MQQSGLMLTEITEALPQAAAKLQRIIAREGDDDGKRLTEEYFIQLVFEQIRINRFAQECERRCYSGSSNETGG